MTSLSCSTGRGVMVWNWNMERSSGLIQEENEGDKPPPWATDFFGSPIATRRKFGWMGKIDLYKTEAIVQDRSTKEHHKDHNSPFTYLSAISSSESPAAVLAKVYRSWERSLVPSNKLNSRSWTNLQIMHFSIQLCIYSAYSHILLQFLKACSPPLNNSQCPHVQTVHTIQHSQPSLQCCNYQWSQPPSGVSIGKCATLLQQLTRCHVLHNYVTNMGLSWQFNVVTRLVVDMWAIPSHDSMSYIQTYTREPKLELHCMALAITQHLLQLTMSLNYILIPRLLLTTGERAWEWGYHWPDTWQLAQRCNPA